MLSSAKKTPKLAGTHTRAILQLNNLDEYWRSMLVDWRLITETTIETIIRQTFQLRQMNRVDLFNSRIWRTSAGRTALFNGSIGSAVLMFAFCWLGFFAFASSSVSGRKKMGRNPAITIIRPITYGVAGSNVIK